MATYGPKYTFDFEATNGDGIQILILQKGRTGLPVSRSLGRAPILKREKSGCVFGTSIEIYAECKVDGEFAELYTSSADEYKVEVYKKPINSNIIQMKIWEGFVSPELYSEPEIAPPYDVQIIATDGLGELKNYTFESAGEVTVREHLDAMLAHTGLSANYNLVSQLNCGGNGMLDVVLDLAHLNGESCYDVLKSVLDSFHACISLHDCQWMIWRETDFATMAASQNVAVFGSMAVAQWWPCGQLSATIMPARNEATIVSESSYKENVLADVQTQMSGNASYDESGKTYILPAQNSAVIKSLSFGEEVGYKLALAITARNYGSGEDEQPLGIKVEIDGRSYAAGDKFWLTLKKDGNPAWYNAESAIEQSLAAPSASDDESNAQTYVLVLPLYRHDNRAYHYATSIKVTIFNPSGVYPIYVHDISLVKAEQGKGYRSVVTIANGAREKADEVEVSIAASERMPAAAKVFMQGVALNGSGELIASWKSSRLSESGYLSFMSRDYALSSALPRMQVQGVLNVPRGTISTPVLFKRDNTYYFPEKYSYDLLNDEISVSLMSIPTATISVVSENVTELAAAPASAGAQSGGGGGGGGSSTPVGDFVTRDQLIEEIGPAAVIYLEPDDEQKEANRAAIAAYVAAEVKPVLYPYGETRATAPFSVTYHEMEDGIEAIIQYKIALGAEPTMGEAYYLISAKILKDGSVEIQNDSPADYVLPTEEYVKEMIGEAYPVYTPLAGQELTEEQKAANKEAYDVIAAAWTSNEPQMPYLYPYDLGRQFPFIVLDFNAEEGLAGLLLNADLMPVPLSDYSLPILGTGLVSISEGFSLYSDGSVVTEYAGNFIAPDIMAMRALIEAKNVETRWLYVSLPGGSITATQQNYNKETVEKIANGGNVKLMIWPLYVPVSHVFADGGIVFTVALYNGSALLFGQGSVGPDGTYEYAEYTIGQGGTGGGGITAETDPIFQASPAAAITEEDIARWNSNTGGGSVTVDTAMSDSSTNPVQNKTVKAYVDSKTATAGQMPVAARVENVYELTPNILHRWSGEQTSLTITLKSVSSAYVQHYMMQFTTSSSGCTLSLPSTIKWQSGLAPVLKPSTTYMISIVNDLGVWSYYE